MTVAEVYRMIEDSIAFTHDLVTEALNDGCLIRERDGTEWWITAEKQS
jgi:hypothetical protein